MTRTKKSPSGNKSITDVARLAGVSITTVSRVINKVGAVKEKNRARVMDAVKELKFQPSVFAQRLATGKSNVVALLIPRYEGVFYSFYALELIRATGTLCEAFKLDLLLHLTDSHTKNLLNLRGVGGLIFSDIIGTRFQIEEALKLGLPCTVINNYVSDLPVSCISVDNSGGARQAVNYLVSLGHKKIAHISGDVSTQAAAKRLEGFTSLTGRTKFRGLPLAFGSCDSDRCVFAMHTGRFENPNFLYNFKFSSAASSKWTDFAP